MMTMINNSSKKLKPKPPSQFLSGYADCAGNDILINSNMDIDRL